MDAAPESDGKLSASIASVKLDSGADGRLIVKENGTWTDSGVPPDVHTLLLAAQLSQVY